MKKIIMLVMAVALAAVLAACNGDDDSADKKENNDKKDEPQSEQASGDKKVEITDDEKVKKDKVVLQINDTKVKGEEYNESYVQTKSMLSVNYGQDVSDKEKMKEQTVNVIIQQELLKQDANKQGIEVTDKEVNSEYKKAKAQNKEQFKSSLEKLNFTEESYKEQLAFELTLQKYIDSELEVNVTDKEVESYYEQMKKQNEAAPDDKKQEIPKLKEIKDKVKQKLAQQKEQQQLQAKVKQLKDKAEIKNKI